ncbi:MAG TPA: AAA family ATPase [Streptosporangiaceae bacterium]
MTAVGGAEPLPVVPFIGRHDELSWLNRAMARVRGGAPATVLIGGDAGVGKSRLVREFLGPARRTALVLTGRCPELGQVGLPFAPFTDMLRQLRREHGRSGLPAGGELLRLLPELTPPAGSPDPKGGRARLFVQMLTMLEQLARQRPVVLVIEDAHWAGASTMELLSFLVDNQDALAGVLIIVTYRSDELHRGHPLSTMLSGLGRFGWVLRNELPGLSRGESDELLGLLLGGEPPARLAAGIHCRADGNPLLIDQLACCARDRTGGPRDLMLGAVFHLPDRTQDVLRAASVGGQRTGQPLLAAVTGMGEAAMTEALGPAVATGVLRAGHGYFAFQHLLTGEALHQDLLPGEHTRLHHRFAGALQADPSLALPGRAAFEQAEHWHHAHDPARELTGAWWAAVEAGRLLARAEQLAMLTRVLELWSRVPGAADLTGAAHDDVLRQAAAAAHAAGHLHLSTALAQAR